MDARLGLVGRGPWGDTYACVLTELGVPFWQAGRDWKEQPRPDGLVIASSTESHFQVAKEALGMGLPVLIEKPACLTAMQAHELIALSGIAFVSHTRLYDWRWRQFSRAMRTKVQSVEAWAGGVNDTNPDADLNWISHLEAMCWDLGDVPSVFHITKERQPLRFVADLGKYGRHEFRDSGGALKNLIQEFLAAIEHGTPNFFDLYIALHVAQKLEKHESCRLHRA